MIVECPHCHISILPSRIGRCPNCQENVNDLNGIDPNIVKIFIWKRSVMPQVCIHCGNATEATNRILVEEESGDGFVYGFAPTLTITYALWFFYEVCWAIGGLFFSRESTKEIKIPHCECCSNREIAIFDVDEDENFMMRITLLGHRKFRDAFRQANRS